MSANQTALRWHIITSEYPPQCGGVSDHTRLLAENLARVGDAVQVWAPPAAEAAPYTSDVIVRRELGAFRLSDLRRVGKSIDRSPDSTIILVQWVPHGYGRRAMNLPFCLWLWKRAWVNRDEVELIVHETFLPFSSSSWKQNVAAIVQRAMTAVVLNAAGRVFVSIPRWEPLLRTYLFGRRLKFVWLPVPSNIPPAGDPSGVARLRQAYAPGGEKIIGHFGTYGRDVSDLLRATIPALLGTDSRYVMLLLGRGGGKFREKLLKDQPHLAARVHSTGELNAADVSRNVSACDVMLQPYPDGVSARRTSAMTALSHGIPLVTTAGHLTEPVWEESEAVTLVPVRSANGLADAVVKVLRDVGLRRRLEESGAALYAERFSVERLVASFRGHERVA